VSPRLWLAVAVPLVAVACTDKSDDDDDDDDDDDNNGGRGGSSADTADYAAVRALLDESCTSCHSPDGTASLLDLSEDGFCERVLNGIHVSPGAPRESLLYLRMSDASTPMPPTGLLPEVDQELVRAWIADGASCREPDASEDSGTADEDDGSPDGEDVYYSVCGGCHGVDAEGGAGPSLQGTALSVAEITSIAMEGTGSMPAMLSGQPDEAEAVARWLVERFGG
jgi:mono/diheme cytochrome c family protein